eukprot:5125065-Pleurochrysis_carterae.AAC.2
MRARFDSNDHIQRDTHAIRLVCEKTYGIHYLFDRVFWEQLERFTVKRHESQYPHAVQYRAVQEMLVVGDLWNYSLGALESYHSEANRVADRIGCKRQSANVGDGATRKPCPKPHGLL